MPARDPSAAEAATAEVDEALGHLRAFDLRPIGELRTRIVHEADWADAWKAYFPVLRIGRRLVIRPSWRRHRRAPDDVVIAMDPGMAFGTGLHPTTRLCLAALEPLADDGTLASAASSTSAAARGSWRSPRCQLGAATALGVDTDPIAIESTTPTPAATGSCAGSGRGRAACPSSEPPFDVVLANLIAGVLVPLAGAASRRAHGRRRRWSPRASSSIARPRSVDGVRGRRPDRDRPIGRGRVGRTPRRPIALTGHDGAPPYNRRARCRPSSRLLLATHIVLAISLFLPSILLPFALRTRRATVESDSRVVRTLLWGQTHGTLVIGAGLALTGLGLIAVLGPQMLQQTWLLLALTIYFVNLGIAFFIQRPNLRGLIGIKAARRRQGVARPGEAPALRLLPDGRPGRDDRVPDELQAGALVSEALHLLPDRGGRDPVGLGVPGRRRRRLPRPDAAGADPHPGDPAAAHRVGRGADRGRRRDRRPLLAAARIARDEGIAEAGYRLVTNIGRWGGQTVDHLHLHLMGGRPFDWPPG